MMDRNWDVGAACEARNTNTRPAGMPGSRHSPQPDRETQQNDNPRKREERIQGKKLRNSRLALCQAM